MRIYTYKNSTQLEKSEYWEDIKRYPHFCASEVLVLGMKNFYGRENFVCLSTIDELINHIFPEWRAAYNDVARYKDISNYVNSLDETVDINIINTFKKNKRNVLDSVKYLFETENLIEEDNYNELILSKLEVDSNKVQKVFKDYILSRILKELYLSSYKGYWKPDWIVDNWIESYLKEALHDCNVEEIRKLMKKIYDKKKIPKDKDTLLKLFETLFNKFGIYNPNEELLSKLECNSENLLTRLGYSADELRYIRNFAINKPYEFDCNAIIIHGLYRLQPIHIRLFKELEKANCEVILLNCYNDEYKKIYSFWVDLYKNLVNIFNIKSNNIKIDKSDGVNHRSIGTVIGNLIEGKNTEGYFEIGRTSIGNNLFVNTSHIKEIFKNDRKLNLKELLAMKEQYPQFTNTIEEIIEELIKRSKAFIKYNSTMQFVECVSQIFDQTVDKSGKRHIGAMKEQFYGARGTEMNNIFQVFYPDEFGVKPFLSYPIGQFILALYNMWDTDKNYLVLNNTDLMECLNLDVWEGISPNLVYEKIRAYIGLEKENNGLTVEEFVDRINTLVEKKEKKYDWIRNKLNNLSFFNVKDNEYEGFKQVINNINKIANRVFRNTNKQTSKEHYANMIKVINEEKQWKSLSGEERKIINEINDRLNSISDEEKTDLDTVKDTLTFYLSNSIGNNINWLVRDLDQIEGDILSEAARAKKSQLKEKCYHYSMLSNENMIESDLEEFPWPLTKEFVTSKEEAKLFNVISRNNVKYKRCLLFQGLYYLIDNPLIKIKLSYIEYENDKKYTPYYLIKQLMNVVNYSETKNEFNYNSELTNSPLDIDEKWDAKAREIISCCPNKFIYSYGLGNLSEQYNSEIQVKMYCGRLIQLWIGKYWDILNEKNRSIGTDTKYNILEAWAKGNIEEFNKIQKTNYDINKLFPYTVKSYLGGYLVDSEIQKLINDNLKYLMENNELIENGNNTEQILKNFDEQLISCWINVAKKHELFDLGDNKFIPICSRVSDYKEFRADNYINEFLMHKNDGFYFNKRGNILEYKISEHICKYCSFRDICLYTYRANPLYLLREKEGIIDK